MSLFASPRSLGESFGVTMLVLSLSGLFPFQFNAVKNKFIISWIYFTLTAFHISMYVYVNITSMMENWRDYAQPMVGHSALTLMGNLALRLLGVIITFLILPPLLIGSNYYVSALNEYMQLIDELILLGIDVKCIYRRIYLSSCFFSLTVVGTLIFTAWHSIYFYEVITERPPELKYYLMAFLSNYYKLLFMFYGNMQFYGIYMISKQLNTFLKDLVKNNRDIYKSKKMLEYSSPNNCNS